VLSEVALPVECDNQTIVYLRWIMTSNTSANNGAVAGGGTSAIDDIIIAGEQGGLSNVYHLQNQNVGDEATAYLVTGLDPETTYYYVVRAVAGTETSANSNVIEVTTTVA